MICNGLKLGQGSQNCVGLRGFGLGVLGLPMMYLMEGRRLLLGIRAVRVVGGLVVVVGVDAGEEAKSVKGMETEEPVSLLGLSGSLMLMLFCGDVLITGLSGARRGGIKGSVSDDWV